MCFLFSCDSTYRNFKNSGKMLSIFAPKYNYEQTFALMNCKKLYLRLCITDEHLAGICAMSTFISNIGKPINNITCHITFMSTDYISHNLQLPILADFQKSLKKYLFPHWHNMIS
jgi:hypothetical protein